MESVIYFFKVGGWTMYGIVLCSVVALAIFFERLWALRVSRVIPRNFLIDVEEMIRRGQIDDAVTLCRKDRSVLSRIVMEGLGQVACGVDAVRRMTSEETERQAYELERGIGVLSMIITLAPLLGFLGTVLGMVELFSSIAAQGEIQNIGVIAGGVYKALYTTVAGLTVAIPATLFHKFCLSTVDQRLLRMEELLLRLVSHMKK